MEQKRKIKIIQVIADSQLGGGPKHVLGLLENLDQDQFDLFLVCPSGWLSTEAKKIKGVEVYNLTFRSKFDLSSLLKLKKIINKIKTGNDPFGPLIIHSHGPRAGFAARFFHVVGAKNIYTEHLYTREYHLGNSINELLQKSLMRRANYKTDLVIAVSTAVRDYLIDSGLVPKDRVVVIPNGIDLKQVSKTESKQDSKGRITIGTVGSLNIQKGQVYLIEAMSMILKKYPEAKLEIVGEGPERGDLESRIKNQELGGKIKLLGRQENIEHYLKNWDVFVLPSISETFGITILEAMAASIPIVATAVGGITDILKDQENGLVAKTKNPADLAEKVIRVLDNQELAAQLIVEGHRTVKEYGWDKVVKKVEDSYQAIWNQESGIRN